MVENAVGELNCAAEQPQCVLEQQPNTDHSTKQSESRIRVWLKACRVHHWVKNILFFVPAVLAHHLEPIGLTRTLGGAVVFGLSSSGVYLLNDCADLSCDRSHSWKRYRPFASGQISRVAGSITGLVLIAVALASAALFGLTFASIILFYVMASTLYSFVLKRTAVIDVFVLSSFYILRMWAGASITSTRLSQWFLAFSLFLFLSLAIAKRYSELIHGDDAQSRYSGRGYEGRDRDILMATGIASCFSAIVVLAVYVHSPDVLVLYHRPGVLLALCPLVLYWTIYVWLKASRGELNGDPVVLQLRDPVTYYVGFAGLAVMFLSR